MAGEHPSEPTLLAYVEGELGGDERASVEAHLTACESCAADLALVREGREAVRAASLLELTSETRARILDTLPVRHATRTTGRRWLAVAAPIAAALALAGGITTLVVVDSSRPDAGGSEGAGVADEASGETAGRESGGGTEGGATTGAAKLFKSVAGSPRELAGELRRKGFNARVERGTLVVRTDRVAKLQRLLGDYPRGAVRIEVK